MYIESAQFTKKNYDRAYKLVIVDFQILKIYGNQDWTKQRFELQIAEKIEKYSAWAKCYLKPLMEHYVHVGSWLYPLNLPYNSEPEC